MFRFSMVAVDKELKSTSSFHVSGDMSLFSRKARRMTSFMCLVVLCSNEVCGQSLSEVTDLCLLDLIGLCLCLMFVSCVISDQNVLKNVIVICFGCCGFKLIENNISDGIN